MPDIDKVILGFIVVILGVVFIGIIASQVLENTEQDYVANESINIAPARLAAGSINTTYQFTLGQAPDSWKLNNADCQINNFFFRNQTGSTLSSGTAYTLTAGTGKLVLANVANLNGTQSNITTVSYNYCGNDYLNQGFGRSTLKLTVGMIALAILVGIVSLIYFYVRKND